MSRWTKLFVLVAVVLVSATFSPEARADSCDITCFDGFEFSASAESNLHCLQKVAFVCRYRGGGWALYPADQGPPIRENNVGDLDLEDLINQRFDDPQPRFCDSLRLASRQSEPVLPQQDAMMGPETPAQQG